jgi:hypothetical protein
MGVITITILKEDILLNNYHDADECPITKALHRAGYIELHDVGRIHGELNSDYISINHRDNSTYRDLILKLFGMYNSMEVNEDNELKTTINNKLITPEPIIIEDFTHTIIF